MPVAVVARHTRRFSGQNGPEIARTSRGQELSKARARMQPCTPTACILIQDAARDNAHVPGTVRQGLLTTPTLLVVADVMARGLAHVNIGRTLQRSRAHLVAHGSSPRGVRCGSRR
jgi:hypothetical protein